ncbi:hypothetical protein C8R46DRAFT_1064426 [Mycena filopes]|nr:hypothetical protein C8R46DRAFT_1064426 [Mycena filopes]
MISRWLLSESKMTNALELYGICICMAILTIFFLSTLCVFPPRRPIAHRIQTAVPGVLHPPRPSMDTLLPSGASANTHLPLANPPNPLVRPDLAVHTPFCHQTHTLLQAAPGWRLFHSLALQAVKLALPDVTTPFHSFVGVVTLCTVIVGLLDPHTDITSSALHDVNIAASLVARLWCLSKTPEPIPEHLLALLHASLRRLLPDTEKYPNPLDFVLPALEPLWRVVAITVAHVHKDPAACKVFRSFCADIAINALRRGGSVTARSVEDYLDKSLELDPSLRPTIHRAFKPSRLTAFPRGRLAARLPPRIDTEISDIESAQRSASCPPESYYAARFQRRPRADPLLAFGYQPLKCEAVDWSRTAAAVIVGAILNHVDGLTHQIDRGGPIGGREGWDGWMVRKLA